MPEHSEETWTTTQRNTIDLAVELYRSQRMMPKLVTTLPDKGSEADVRVWREIVPLSFRKRRREMAQHDVLEQLTGIEKMPESRTYPVLDMRLWLMRPFMERQRERHVWRMPFSTAHTMEEKIRYKDNNRVRWRDQKDIFLAGGVITADYCPLVECRRYRKAFLRD